MYLSRTFSFKKLHTFASVMRPGYALLHDSVFRTTLAQHGSVFKTRFGDRWTRELGSRACRSVLAVAIILAQLPPASLHRLIISNQGSASWPRLTTFMQASLYVTQASVSPTKSCKPPMQQVPLETSRSEFYDLCKTGGKLDSVKALYYANFTSRALKADKEFVDALPESCIVSRPILHKSSGTETVLPFLRVFRT